MKSIYSQQVLVSQRNGVQVERTFLTVEFKLSDKVLTGPRPRSMHLNRLIGRLFKEIESRFFSIDQSLVVVVVALGLLFLNIRVAEGSIGRRKIA